MKRIALTFILLLGISNSIFSKNDESIEYIKKYRKIAVKEMKKYGVPASITLAQGILESGNGKSRLAKKGKNHFGIKCGNDWDGKTIREDDDELNECFRKYKKAEHSFRDHSMFIANKERYAFLFELDRDDYVSWAYGLKKAGYATNPSYPTLLISIIEKYDLNKYDKKNAKKTIKKEEEADKNIAKEPKEDFEYYTVSKGDTMYSISKKLNIDIDKLKKLNGKKDNSLYVGEKIRIK